MSGLIVQLSRRISRQLELGKGMFFDSAAMEEMAAAGVWDVAHKCAGDRQREEAVRRRAESEAREAERYGQPAISRGATPGERRTFARRRAHGLHLVDPDQGQWAQRPAEDDVSEVLARVRRKLGMPGDDAKEALARAQRILKEPKAGKEK